MAKVEFSATALRTLRSIHAYTSQDSDLYANKVINNIIKRIKVLEVHIRIGKVVPRI